MRILVFLFLISFQLFCVENFPLKVIESAKNKFGIKGISKNSNLVKKEK